MSVLSLTANLVGYIHIGHARADELEENNIVPRRFPVVSYRILCH